MFTLKQTANDRWQITATPEAFTQLSLDTVTALLWRSYPTAQEAFAAAAGFWFDHCDKANRA